MKIQKITGTVETLEACNITKVNKLSKLSTKYQKRQVQRFIAEYFSTIKSQIILWTTLKNGQF